MVVEILNVLLSVMGNKVYFKVIQHKSNEIFSIDPLEKLVFCICTLPISFTANVLQQCTTKKVLFYSLLYVRFVNYDFQVRSF